MRSSIQRKQNVVIILLNKNNPNYDPSREENKENPRLVPKMDHQSINDEFHNAFQKIYSKLRIVLRLFKNFLIEVATRSPRNTSNPMPGPEKMFSFLGAQISMSYLPGEPVIFDSFSVATINSYSSFSWAEIVI